MPRVLTKAFFKKSNSDELVNPTPPNARFQRDLVLDDQIKLTDQKANFQPYFDVRNQVPQTNVNHHFVNYQNQPPTNQIVENQQFNNYQPPTNQPVNNYQPQTNYVPFNQNQQSFNQQPILNNANSHSYHDLNQQQGFANSNQLYLQQDLHLQNIANRTITPNQSAQVYPQQFVQQPLYVQPTPSPLIVDQNLVNGAFVNNQQMYYLQQPQPLIAASNQLPINSYWQLPTGSRFAPKGINAFIYAPLSEQEQAAIMNSTHTQMLQENLDVKKLPHFYRREITSARNKVLFWIFLLLAGLALASWLVFEVVVHAFNPWIFLPVALYFVVICFFLAISASDLINFKKEAAYQNNQIDRTKATNFIVHLYRKLIVAHININWFAASLYLTVAFFIAGIFVVAYFMNLYNNAAAGAVFGELVVRKITDPTYLNKNPMYALIGVGTILGLMFLIHLWVIFQAHHRLNRIHSFYANEIISGEEIAVLKKQANRRGLIIFLVICVILGLLFYLMYIIIKRRGIINK